ncbi:hypothetical protein FE236_10205 [Mariprofundus erugo]|uniref:hypothetical protein n=1 Tax=Mariprofundus erugo TaxID=2528639 RepID=UPI0010FDD5CD|nr:hypothetical protein [Mariprofundus erugo]TLS75023.1 hypothetical protein FE236_10205 [Mariprofundus erugo]
MSTIIQQGKRLLHRLASGRLFRGAKSLGVSWIQGDVHVVYYRGRHLPQRWKSDTPVHTADQFRDALIKAKGRLRIGAECEVFMVLDQDQMSHSQVQAPPVKNKDLRRFLARQIETEQTFVGDAAWSWSNALSDDRSGKHHVLMHMMPKTDLDEIIERMLAIGFYPKAIVPLAEVLNSHICRLDIDPEETLVLLASFAGKTDILVARGSGKILFIRDLPYSAQDNYQQVLRDVELSVLYAKQKFSALINKVSVAGESSTQLEEFLKENLKLEFILPDDDWHHPYCWAMDAAEFRGESTANLVPAAVRRSHLVHNSLRWTVAGTGLLAVSAVLVVGEVEYIIANSQQVIGGRQELRHLQSELRSLESSQQQFEEQSRRIDYFSVNSAGEHGVNFLRYLGKAMPSKMILLKVNVVDTKAGQWTFVVDGMMGANVPVGEAVTYIESLGKALESRPLNAKLEDWQGNLDQVLHSGGAHRRQQLRFNFKGSLQ